MTLKTNSEARALNYEITRWNAALSIAIAQLLPNQLKDQYCFLTEKAVGCLEFVEARKYGI